MESVYLVNICYNTDRTHTTQKEAWYHLTRFQIRLLQLRPAADDDFKRQQYGRIEGIRSAPAVNGRFRR